jgi:hypothetical protein
VAIGHGALPLAMNTSQDSAFAHFVRRRRRLNERLDETRGQIDAWIAEHENQTPTMVDLATLEALLQTRRDALAALVALDDEFMSHLIELRSSPGGPPAAPPAS